MGAKPSAVEASVKSRDDGERVNPAVDDGNEGAREAQGRSGRRRHRRHATRCNSQLGGTNEQEARRNGEEDRRAEGLAAPAASPVGVMPAGRFDHRTIELPHLQRPPATTRSCHPSPESKNQKQT